MTGEYLMHLSDSTVQQNAEKVIVRKLEKQIGLAENTLLETNVLLTDRTYVVFDGFNKDEGVIAEAYARIGKLGPSQKNKIVTDVMKMILTEKVLNKDFKKIIAVCDDSVYEQMSGLSWKSLAISEFDIKVMKVDIDDSLKNKIVNAQKRQYR